MSMTLAGHYYKYVLGFCALILAGCAGPEVKDTIPVWPQPPEAARYTYSGVLRNQASLNAESSLSLELTTGAASAQGGAPVFAKPFDIVARKGKVIISDTAARVLHLFDLPGRKVYQLGYQGDGKLIKPTGIGMDGLGKIYVADTTAQQVMIYDENGHYKARMGSKENLVKPTDVCANADGSRIYVVDSGGIDSGKHQVVVFDAEGHELSVIGRRGSGPGEFNLPSQCEVSPRDGRLYVLDSGNFRVEVFESDGGFISQWGKVGRNYGELARPRGLALDEEDNVYITDSAFANFQVFTAAGQLLLDVGGPSRTDKPGAFSLPAGIAVDDKGFVYVVDQRFNKVEVIRKNIIEKK